MTYKLTLELITSTLFTEDFAESCPAFTLPEIPSEIEVTSTEDEIGLCVAGVLNVTLTAREAVMLASIILERAYKQIN